MEQRRPSPEPQGINHRDFEALANHRADLDYRGAGHDQRDKNYEQGCRAHWNAEAFHPPGGSA